MDKTKLFERLVGILNAQDKDAVLDALILDVEVKPGNGLNKEELRIETFFDLGVTVIIDRSRGNSDLSMVSLLARNAMIDAGKAFPYSGNLPFGISLSDNRDQVRSKLGVDPVQSEPWLNNVIQDNYVFDNLILSFVFDMSDQHIGSIFVGKPAAFD